MTKITKGNCIFEEISGNEIYNIIQVSCPGYEDDYIKTERTLDLSFNEIIENYKY